MFTKFASLVCSFFLLLFVWFAPVNNSLAADPFFFKNQVSLGNDIYYSSDFGYYYLGYYSSGVIYKYGYGFLYSFGADAGGDGAFFYDFITKDFLFTSGSVYEYPNAP